MKYNDLGWCDAPKNSGTNTTSHNRWKSSSDTVVFVWIMTGLPARDGEEKAVLIDARYLKETRTASSTVVKKGAL